MSLLRVFFRSEDGVAAVEFAMIAPILLLLMLGLFDFGFYINASMQMESAARAGAEYVLKGGTEDAIQADVLDQTDFGLNNERRGSIQLASSTTCECRAGDEVSCDTGSCSSDDFLRRFVTVQVSMPYNALFTYPGLPESVTITGSARLEIEQP